MSPAIDFGGTCKPVLDVFPAWQAEEVRVATDITSPLELMLELEERSSGTLTATLKHRAAEQLFLLVRPVMDPWLLETIGTLASYREYKDGWDGDDAIAPERGQLRTAEMLAEHFSHVPVRKRPLLSLDVAGRPTFSANSAGFYLHLTVDAADQLTWYAEVGGVQHFESDARFDGRRLPDGLVRIFSSENA
jgi:hypothetical protein